MSELLARADCGGETRRPRGAGVAEDRQHSPRRLGLGRQHAAVQHQAVAVHFGGAGDLVAEAYQA